MTLSINFLQPDQVIDSQGTVLEQTTGEAPVPTVDFISSDVQASTQSISSFGSVISYIALFVLLILLFKGAYPLLLVTEVFQHIYFHYFLVEDLPYNYSNFLLKLNYLNFQFLPNMFISFVPSNYVSTATPTKFKDAIGQTTFFISSGHYFTLIIIYIGLSLLIALLKNKSINKFYKIRRFFKKLYLTRIRFNAIN